MRVEQEKDFKPITIVLETEDEANAFIAMIDSFDGTELPKEFRELVIAICNAFTQVNL